MQKKLVITWPCVRSFPPTTTRLAPITEKELERKTKQNKNKKKKERKETKFIVEEKKHLKFKAAIWKWQMLAASNVKVSCSEKKK